MRPGPIFLVLTFWGASFGQGTIHFNTYIPGVVDAPITFGVPDGAGPGPTHTAELLKIEPNGLHVRIPGSVTTFRRAAPGEDPRLEAYVVPISVVEIPGTIIGGVANLRIGVYLTSHGVDPAFPCYAGLSPAFTVQGLGGGVLPPANLAGAPPTILSLNSALHAECVPEQSVTAFLGLGTALVGWTAHRKKLPRPCCTKSWPAGRTAPVRQPA
jgi:hypothetical protein